MAYFPDLAPLDYFTSGETFDDRLRAVGWLSPRHPFPMGELDPADLARLTDLLEHGQEIISALGAHSCLLCPGSEGVDEGHSGIPIFVRVNDGWRDLGAANLWLPAGDLMYVAPSLIIHYVVEHRYLPPREYLSALAAAPRPGSTAYREAMASFSDFIQSKLGQPRE